MTMLVTGGAGFIGSNFLLSLLNRYPERRVVCLDKLTYAGALSNLSDILEKPNFREALRGNSSALNYTRNNTEICF